MNRRKGKSYLGTSGYQYDHWKGVFYPEKLPKKDWFRFYSERFDTVEINNTFYHLPGPETFDKWRKDAPREFCYAVKFSRYGSHIKRLKDPEATIGKFLKNAQRLEETLGPILVQLPPHWGVDLERLATFLEAAPGRYRWTVEFRDPAWLCGEVYELLEKHRVALCVHDMIENHPFRITADWVYLRFHGDHYGDRYSPQALTAQSRRIHQCLEDRLDVYAYFNNDKDGHAAANAADLKRYLSNRKETG